MSRLRGALSRGATIAQDAREGDQNAQNNAHFTGRNYNGWKVGEKKILRNRLL